MFYSVLYTQNNILEQGVVSVKRFSYLEQKSKFKEECIGMLKGK